MSDDKDGDDFSAAPSKQPADAKITITYPQGPIPPSAKIPAQPHPPSRRNRSYTPGG